MWFARLAALATLALAVVAATFAVEAQPAKVARVGRLNGEGVFTPNGPLTAELLRGLREQGYAEGQNLAIEYRSAEGRNEAFPALVADTTDPTTVPGPLVTGRVLDNAVECDVFADDDLSQFSSP